MRKGSVGKAWQTTEEPVWQGLPSIITAAHELKAPLALIRQLSLALEVGGANDAERERLLRQIVLVSERGLRLTTDLSRSARLDDSLFELEPLNPQQLCEEVAHELIPLYKAHGREIRVASHQRPLLAVANRELLRRVMLNFSDNALHYTEDTAPVELRAGRCSAGEKIRLSVRDYGPAIPTNMWAQLYHHLGSSAQVLHMRPQSSGLGLYIAGQFAELMQGKIGATRHRDGTTFYIDIAASRQLSLL